MFQIIDKKYDSDSYEIEEYLKNWPMIYLLENGKQVYVGQSNRVSARIDEHKSNEEKKFFRMIHMIYSTKFNLSATLDYESRLIQLIAADKQYVITNKNEGIAHRDYYNKGYYDTKFQELWNKLMQYKLVKHSIPELLNSDLFKYSPYKELTKDQKITTENILRLLAAESESTIIVKGMPGTGKTIMCSYLY